MTKIQKITLGIALLISIVSFVRSENPIVKTKGFDTGYGAATTTVSNGLGIATSSAYTSPLTVESGANTTNGFFTGSSTSYTELNIQNRSTGVNASALYTVTADIGNASTYFSEFGINNSLYSQSAFNSQNALDSFIDSSDGALIVGTASSTNSDADIRFITGGTASSSIRMEIKKSGKVGIATTSPFAAFSLAGVAGTIPVAVSTTTATSASTTLFMVDQAGDVHLGGGTPALSSCGTAPSLGANSTDQAGTITAGSAAGGCTLTFSVTKPSIPHCVVTEQTFSLTNALSYTESISALTLTEASSGGAKFDYICALGH